MRWPWQKAAQPRALVSVADPQLVTLFQLGSNFAGVPVGESTALGLSAVYRAVALISGTIGGLPLHSFREVDGIRTRVGSFLDNPGGLDGPTPFEWRETVMIHLLLHGNAFLAHVPNAGGGIAGLVPIHPLRVAIDEMRPLQAEFPPPRHTYTATLLDGTRRVFTSSTMTHIPALVTDGVRGLSPITVARNSLGKGIAADRAAASMFSNGALMSGLVTPEEDMSEEEAAAVKAGLDRKAAGWENASQLAVINRKLKLTPWTFSPEDAQFLQSRQFEIQEIARWFGVNGSLLMDPGAVSTWGTGVEIQNRGLARYTLAPWTRRIEERLSRLLPAPRFAEFDFAGLLKPSAEQEIPLLISQVQAGLMTPNEARRLRGMDPMPGGDTLRGQQLDQPAEEPVDEPEPAGVPG